MDNTKKLIKNIQGNFNPPKLTPIATDMYIPNHSGIASHPEFKKALGDLKNFETLNVEGDAEIGGNLTANGINAGFNWDSPDGGLLKNFRIEREPDIININLLDYQDEAAYWDKRANSVSVTPTPSGSLSNMFEDTSTTISYGTGVNPYPLVIEIDSTTRPILPAGSGSYQVGLTLRNTGAAQPEHIKIECWNGTGYDTLFDDDVNISELFASWVSPRFLAPSSAGFEIRKLKVTLSRTSAYPGTAIFRLQRFIVYHPTSVWNPWELKRTGGEVYGSVTLKGAHMFKIDGGTSSFEPFRIIGSAPGMVQEVYRTTGSAHATPINQVFMRNDTAIVQEGVFGVIGSNNLGGNPIPWYLYMDARTNGSFDNATLKIDANNRVGIGFTGTTRPAETLDVNGTIKGTNYKSSDGSTGITQTITINDGNDTGAHTLTFKNGILTAYSFS
jgi:hypothetical protein